MTCDRVDQEGLDTRYLAGKLGEAEAEAFEAHYFECDRCWALVHRGVEVRAAGRPTATARNPPIRAIPWRKWAWVPLAAAAAAVLWLGIRTTPVVPRPGSDSTTRGTEGGTMSVRVISGGAELKAAWPKVTSATDYQVRLFDPSGALLWERRIPDTAVSVARDSLPGGQRGGGGAILYWQVQALDPTGAAVARSALVEIAPGSPRP